ncbi:MAG: outer membrane beta-barrel protein [Gammaproteobacteria bacterium]|nr:outer membrane beta-barrel protein [Gammaproteobacteria bacterium]MYK44436.1 outer membrane beta-barrel protein [Gammaproteobacteria bacterium]
MLSCAYGVEVNENQTGKSTKWYLVGGLLHYTNSSDRNVGDGQGIYGSVGIQFTRTFGIEFIVDYVPEHEPVSPEQDQATPIRSGLKAKNHVANSLTGTIRTNVRDTLMIVGKLGIAGYRYDLDEEDDGGVSFVGSIGIDVPLGESDDWSIEVSITQLFSAETDGTSLIAGLKYSF